MDTTQKATILAHLNTLATTTLEESDFAPWNFTDVKLQAGKYVLAFKNDAGKDDVSFPFSGSPVDGAAVAAGFTTAAKAAIERWEAAERGDDDEDEDEDEDEGEDE